MLETCVIDMATLYPILVSHVYLTRHNLHAECFLCIQWTLVEDSLNLAPLFQWLRAPSLSNACKGLLFCMNRFELSHPPLARQLQAVILQDSCSYRR